MRKKGKHVSRSFLTVFMAVVIYSGGTPAVALDEDECDNDAIPRSTPSSDFTITGDGSTVIHETTGLEWHRCLVGQTPDRPEDLLGCDGTAAEMTWQQALQYAHEQGGNWRVPTVTELLSIVEECRVFTAINREVFPDAETNYTWTSTPMTESVGSEFAWVVPFGNAWTIGRTKTSTQPVRLVRFAP